MIAVAGFGVIAAGIGIPITPGVGPPSTMDVGAPRPGSAGFGCPIASGVLPGSLGDILMITAAGRHCHLERTPSLASVFHLVEAR